VTPEVAAHSNLERIVTAVPGVIHRAKLAQSGVRPEVVVIERLSARVGREKRLIRVLIGGQGLREDGHRVNLAPNRAVLAEIEYVRRFEHGTESYFLLDHEAAVVGFGNLLVTCDSVGCDGCNAGTGSKPWNLIQRRIVDGARKNERRIAGGVLRDLGGPE